MQICTEGIWGFESGRECECEVVTLETGWDCSLVEGIECKTGQVSSFRRVLHCHAHTRLTCAACFKAGSGVRYCQHPLGAVQKSKMSPSFPSSSLVYNLAVSQRFVRECVRVYRSLDRWGSSTRVRE